MTIGREPKITLGALDIHPLCDMGIDSKQGEQSEPKTIINKFEFRCLTQCTMP